MAMCNCNTAYAGYICVSCEQRGRRMAQLERDLRQARLEEAEARIARYRRPIVIERVVERRVATSGVDVDDAMALGIGGLIVGGMVGALLGSDSKPAKKRKARR